MGKGDRTPPEWRMRTDPRTGVRVRQLTNYRGNSYHLYFTSSGWHRQGRSLLFGSDRGNDTNLFSVDLESGAITQLTEYLTPPLPGGRSFHGASLNPCREEVYYWHGGELVALDLETLAERVLCTAPSGMGTGNIGVTADGEWVCTQLHQDLSDRLEMDLGHGYVGFREYWEANPHCQVVRSSVARGGLEVVFEDRVWIGHVNTSTRLPRLLTFCHEGPWHLVGQRMWGLDLETGQTWPLRPQEPEERVGHEYWFQDGERIGYQGWDVNGDHFFGCIRHDNQGRMEAPFPAGSMHFHSNDERLVVGDGGARAPDLMLWRFREGRFEGPRLVLRHRSSFHIQDVHVHPRFNADCSQILYASDAGGYGNIFLVDVPAFDDLPPAEGTA